MPLLLCDGKARDWQIRHIGVIGPGIVGMPMAAMLAQARVRIGTDIPAMVTVVQRPSPSSGWKVDAINAGRSPMGGVEPDLDRLVDEAVTDGTLRATHDMSSIADADVVLVSVQTDRVGDAPDYGPLTEATSNLARALRHRPPGNIPLIIFESTLAPSSMSTVVRELFASFGLHDGHDILLGNSPNRVMPGRLVDRVANSDKLVAGLHPETADLIHQLYSYIVTGGTLHRTNCMTAEVVKVLENAYRDVRIAYSATVARDCDARDVSFYEVRDAVNECLAQTDNASSDTGAVPTGGMLIPTIGVGGHCLPKDGILLWWRARESRLDPSKSVFLNARKVNDESPAALLALSERNFGTLEGRAVSLLGVAYRPDSNDTRSSPSLRLAKLLANARCAVTLHDPYVAAHDRNLLASGFGDRFTASLEDAVARAEIVILCTGHAVYANNLDAIFASSARARGFVDGCNIVPRRAQAVNHVTLTGIGRGRRSPSNVDVDAVHAGFRRLEKNVAREVRDIIDLLNDRYADDSYNRIEFSEVRRLAATCPTGCLISE